MEPVLESRHGLWVGWPGVVEGEPDGWREALETVAPPSYDLVPVLLTPDERELYYHGFSNEVLWPLFHDLQCQCRFEPAYWEAYRTVNQKIARTVAAEARQEDVIWIQDYHLIPLAADLDRLGVRSKKGFFLHIPFPPLDLFLKLPWDREVLDLLLAHDLVGFQTRRDVVNFLGCIRALREDVRVDGDSQSAVLHLDGREIRVGAFPIGIDARAFRQKAARLDVTASAERLRRSLGRTRMALGVDRLDYSKGIPAKLRAFRKALETYPELQQRLTLVQILAPSRETIPEYMRLRSEVECLVGQINGELGTPGWVPVHYLNRSFSQQELLSYYQAADICLVTPIKDGMNLVAKEFVAASVDGRGVLVLSEFAGAADQLGADALLVNPYDEDEVATQLYRAWTMSEAEQHSRMERLSEVVEREDIGRWTTSFFDALDRLPAGRTRSWQRLLRRPPRRAQGGSTRRAREQAELPPMAELPRAG